MPKKPPTAEKSNEGVQKPAMQKGKEWGAVVVNSSKKFLVIDPERYIKEQMKVIQVVGTASTRLAEYSKDTRYLEFVQNLSDRCSPSKLGDENAFDIEHVIAAEITNKDLLQVFMDSFEICSATPEYSDMWLQLAIARWKLSQFSYINCSDYDEICVLREVISTVVADLCQRKNLPDGASQKFNEVVFSPNEWNDQTKEVLNSGALDFAASSVSSHMSFDEFMTEWWKGHHHSLMFQALEKCGNSDLSDALDNTFDWDPRHSVATRTWLKWKVPWYVYVPVVVFLFVMITHTKRV